MELCNIAHMRHRRQIAPGNGHRLGHDLAGPQGLDSEEFSRIGETPDSVKQGTKGQLF